MANDSENRLDNIHSPNAARELILETSDSADSANRRRLAEERSRSFVPRDAGSIENRRSGIERRQDTRAVPNDTRKLINRRRDDALQTSDIRMSGLKVETGAIDIATIETPLTIAEKETLARLAARASFAQTQITSGTQRHERAVAAGTELAFYQKAQGGYPTDQTHLKS